MNPPGDPHDALLQRYHEASAQEGVGPGAQVRSAVLAHARAVVDAQRPATGNASPGQTALRGTASNEPRWKIRALASVAVLGLAGLLTLQLDRGTPEQKELVQGQPSPFPAAVQAPAAAPAAPVMEPGTSTAANGPRTADTPVRDGVVAQRKAAAPSLREQPGTSVATATAPERSDTDAPVAAALASPAAPAPPQKPETAAPAAAGMSRQPDASSDATGQERRRELAQALRAPSGAPAAESRQRFAAPRLAGPTGALAPAMPDLASLLQRAVRVGSMADVEALLAHAAPVDAVDAEGRTPLMLAVRAGRTDMVRRLLAAGANAALRDREGLTALELARRSSREDIVQLLVGGS